MDYKNALDYLEHLQFVGRKYGFLHSNLNELEQRRQIAKNVLESWEKKWFTRLFNKEFYYNMVYNARMDFYRVDDIVKIFEANPNKENEPNVTLKEIVERGILSAMDHVSQEDIKTMRYNDSMRSLHQGGDRNISITAKPEFVYFKAEEVVEEPTAVKEVEHTKEVETLNDGELTA